jgi:hypothetical protein
MAEEVSKSSDLTGGDWKPAPTGQKFDPQPKNLLNRKFSTTTNRTDLTVPAVGETCTTNDCPPRGNAMCIIIEVRVPLAANITAVRFYSTANAPDDFPVAVLMAPGTDRGWSFYDGWGERSDGTTKMILGSYHNRSDDRPRRITLEVDFI